MRGKLKHGHWGSPTYYSWATMIQRTTNPRNTMYRYYGGRGITVCDRWRSFENFFADMGERPIGTTLDRRNNSKGYSPENCRWVTRSEQQNNKRDTRFFTVGDVTLSYADWAHRIGLHPKTLENRIKLGWLPEHIIALPAKRQKYLKRIGEAQ